MFSSVFTCGVVGALRDLSLEVCFGVVARFQNAHIFTVFPTVHEEALSQAISRSLDESQMAVFSGTAELSAHARVGNVGQVS